MKEGLPLVDKHMVVVLSITYNHAQYVEETLKGFAMQQTDFPFLCCVFDDASTDGEQEILKRWIEEHCNQDDIEIYNLPLTIILKAPDKDNPNCIYAIHLMKVNTWGKPERSELLSYWYQFGKYIAMCEGDDYWIDPSKLQKQVDFLEANPDYGLVYTQVESFDENKIIGPIARKITNANSLLLGNYIATLTTCLRSELLLAYYKEVKPNEKGWLMGDYPMWLWISLHSKIHFFEETMGRYRRLQNSASHSTDINKTIAFENSILDIRLFYINKFWNNDKRLLKKVYAINTWKVFKYYRENHMEELAFKLFLKRYKMLPLKNKIKGLYLWSLFAKRNK